MTRVQWIYPLNCMADQYTHETRVQGDRHPAAKLTAEEMRDISRLWNSQIEPGHARHTRLCGHTWTKTALAEKFGVSHSVISEITTGKAWAYRSVQVGAHARWAPASPMR